MKQSPPAIGIWSLAGRVGFALTLGLTMAMQASPARADFIQMVFSPNQQLVVETTTGGQLIHFVVNDLNGPGPIPVGSIGVGVTPVSGDLTLDIAENAFVLNDSCTG